MPDYVYALHDFQPEHEDELPFRAGERVEVVEKDDLYGDGWWQGRNLAGQVGLFPQSYTAPVPPTTEDPVVKPSTTTETVVTDSASRSTLQPLEEVPETESPADTTPNIIAPQPQAQLSAVFFNQNDNNDDSYDGSRHKRAVSTSSGEVMKATMTDVQQAIEQLGRGPNGDRDDRSFSFASSRGETTENEDDYDMSDLDGVDPDNGEGWHKGARRKLAAKAKKAVEEAEKLEAMINGVDPSRRLAPPIEVELSDESDGEDDYITHTNVLLRRHSRILEEDGEPQINARDAEKRSGNQGTHKEDTSNEIVLPERTEMDPHTAKAAEFPLPADIDPPSPKLHEGKDAPHSYSPVTPVSPEVAPPAVTVQESKREYTPYRESMIALPSPTGSFPGTTSADKSKYMSVMSNYSIASTTSEISPPLRSSAETTYLEEREREKQDKTHPSEWTLEDVVNWLKSKGFDQDVCDKFIEQEITGDVLLDLDVNLLKTEIGIMAFGKRMRIANAITDLRRPPSIVYSDHQPGQQLSPLQSLMTHANSHQHISLTPSHSVSQVHTHSRSVSQSHSHHSFPGTPPAGYMSPQRSSLGSAPAAGYVVHNGNGNSYGYGIMTPNESPATESMVSEALVPESERLQQPVGLGFPANLSNGKVMGRPAQLMLSPSDSALKASAMGISLIPEADEDRGHMSDGETVSTSMRHRIFRRSHDSRPDSAPNSRHSRETSISGTPGSPDKDVAKDKDKERNRPTSKGGERLSIFGGSFGGTLGKSRKPAPKYSSGSTDEIDKSSSMFGIPRLHSSASKRVPRPSTSNGTVSSKNSPRFKDTATPAPVAKETKEKEVQSPTVLRKRTTSAPIPPASPNSPVSNGVASPLKEGQNVLMQIGDPDHSGWMRKRGDRYNNWKLRYFVLKGQHLYWLKSSSSAETKIKGFLHIVGYKVTVDENVNPGRYGFRIEHDQEKTHYFSSDEKVIVRDWMKAIMKATIDRDYTRPVISSCNIATIPLMVAQAMNPAPRPPSPGARDATQKALRRENPNQLSSRDARVLMGLPSTNGGKEDRARLESFFSLEPANHGDDPTDAKELPKSPAPPRPSREMRRSSVSRSSANMVDDTALIDWANSHLPSPLQITYTGSLCGGLGLLRIAESIKGRPLSPPVPDSAFPASHSDDKLDGLFRLFDFLLDNEVKMGSVSINDIRQAKREKIIQLLKALKAWEDKRKAIAQSISGASSVQAGGFIASSKGYIASA